MGDVFLLAFLAALYPTLLAATTVMLILPHPRRLLLGYLLGAAMTSVTLGLVIVFALKDSGALEAGKVTLGPGEDIALGLIALAIGFVLGTGRDRPLAERRRVRKAAKGKVKEGPPRWQRELGRGSARVTFAVGAVLTLPGATYIAALSRIADEELGPPLTVLSVLAFNLIMLSLLELPLLSYTFAPEWTPQAIERAKAKLRLRGRVWATRAALVFGSLMVLRGVLTLIIAR
jgi:Sap, sulfolipid-1-addressing protein